MSYKTPFFKMADDFRQSLSVSDSLRLRESERQPFTTFDLELDDDVTYRTHQDGGQSSQLTSSDSRDSQRSLKSRGCHVGRPCCVVIILFVLLLLLLNAFLATLIVLKPCFGPTDGALARFFYWCPQNTSHDPLVTSLLIADVYTPQTKIPAVEEVLSQENDTNTTEPTDSDQMPTVKPTIVPKALLPWEQFRLPRSVKPVTYNLQLTVDVKKRKFSGTIEIEIKCVSSTRYIVLHASAHLQVEQVSVRNYTGSIVTILPLRRSFHAEEREYFVMEMQEVLVAGGTYRVWLGSFGAPLNNFSHGLYLSQYTDSKNRSRSISISFFNSLKFF